MPSLQAHQLPEALLCSRGAAAVQVQAPLLHRHADSATYAQQRLQLLWQPKKDLNSRRGQQCCDWQWERADLGLFMGEGAAQQC
jgi:hypothetical protein